MTLALIMMFLPACESGLDETETPTLSVDPTEVIFANPEETNGDALIRRVILSNTGTGDLVIASVTLDEEGDDAQELFLSDADDWTRGTRTLPPGDSATLSVVGLRSGTAASCHEGASVASGMPATPSSSSSHAASSSAVESRR